VQLQIVLCFLYVQKCSSIYFLYIYFFKLKIYFVKQILKTDYIDKLLGLLRLHYKILFYFFSSYILYDRYEQNVKF